MKTVAETTTFVIVGKHPRSNAADLLGDVPAGGEALVLVMGLHPTVDQQRLTEEAHTLAAERRFVLTAEMIARPPQLHERMLGATIIRVAADRGERRRWQLGR
jgi:hypothetical protein